MIASRRRCWIEIAIVSLAASVFVFWGGAWLFREEFWGIDDPTRFRTTLEALEAYRAEGVWAWWKTLRGFHGNNYGPTMSIYPYFTCLGFGASHAWPYHALKALQFILCIVLLWATARNLGGGIAGAWAAVFLAVFANSTRVLPDMQTYSANWWRLYTTDSFGTLPLMIFWWSLSMATLSRRRRAFGIWLAAAAAGYFIAIMAKANYAVLLPAVFIGFVLGGACGAFRRRHLGGGGAYAVALILLGATAFPVYNVGTGKAVEVQMYESQSLSFGWPILSEGLRFYNAILEDTGAWLWWMAAGWAAVVIPILLIRRRRTRPTRIWRDVIVLTALAAGLGGLILQSAWPIRLPRYALSFVPCLALATGVATGRVHRALWQRKPAWRCRTLPEWGAILAASLVYLVALGILYAPDPRGYPRLMWVAGLLIFVAVAALVLLVLERVFRWRHRLGSALATGLVAITLLVQMGAMGFMYLEARTAFQVFYRGQNDLKVFLREAPEAPKPPHGLWTNVTGEFLSNTLWFLRTYEGRSDFALNGQPTPPASFSPSTVVHIATYPHPPAMAQWVPAGKGEWRYKPWANTGTKMASVLSLGLDDPPILLGIPRTPSSKHLGLVVLRFDTRSLPWNRCLEVVVTDEQGNPVGETTYAGIDTPRQHTNLVPVAFDPPLLLPANTRHILQIRTRPSPEWESSRIARSIRPDTKTLFLRMEPPEGAASSEPLVGIELILAEPWDPELEARFSRERTVAALALHVEAPAAAVRRILDNKGYGYSTQAIRWVRYAIFNSIVVLDSPEPSFSPP